MPCTFPLSRTVCDESITPGMRSGCAAKHRPEARNGRTHFQNRMNTPSGIGSNCALFLSFIRLYSSLIKFAREKVVWGRARKLRLFRGWMAIRPSHTQQVGLELGISALLRPQIQRHRRKFVNRPLGQTVLRQIHRFYVGLARVAALDPNVRKRFRRIDRQLGVILLTATLTD